MVYLIESPRKYKFKEEAQYDHEVSFDRFVFRRGNIVSHDELDKPLLFNLKITIEKALQFDQIINDSACLLVNQKVKSLLEQLSFNEVQFFDTVIRCKDGVLNNYKLVNITQAVEGVDHEKSVYRKMVNIDAIGGFKRLVLTEGCMGKYKLARLAEFKGHMLATEEVKEAFEAENITGVRFVTPEDWYREACPGYALD